MRCKRCAPRSRSAPWFRKCARKPTPWPATLSDLLAVRKQIVDERDRLAKDIEVLGREQLRMTLLIDQRQKKQAVAEQALDTERAHATDLAHQVDTIKDLIAKLEQDLDPATRAKRDSARSIENDATKPNLAALGDPGRLSPAMAFADMRGHLRLPVNGARIRDFGGSDGCRWNPKGTFHRGPARCPNYGPL